MKFELLQHHPTPTIKDATGFNCSQDTFIIKLVLMLNTLAYIFNDELSMSLDVKMLFISKWAYDNYKDSWESLLLRTINALWF